MRSIRYFSVYSASFFNIIYSYSLMFTLTKRIGVLGYGHYTFVSSVFAILSSVIGARTSLTVTKFVKEALLQKNDVKLNYSISVCLILDIAIFTTIIIVGFLLASSTTIFKNHAFTLEVSILIGALSSIEVLRSSATGTLIGFDKLAYVSTVKAIELFIKTILSIYIFWFIEVEYYVTLIYYLFGTSIAFTAIFLVNLLHRFDFTIIAPTSLKSELKHHLINGFWISTFKTLNNYVENILINFFLGLKEVGSFAILRKLLSPFIMLMSPLSYIALTKFINVQENIEAVKKTIIKTNKIIFFLWVGYLSAIVMTFPLLISLMSDLKILLDLKLELVLISLGSLAIALTWWGASWSSNNNQHVSLKFNIISFFSYVLFGTLLIPQVGLLGQCILYVLNNSFGAFYFYSSLLRSQKQT